MALKVAINGFGRIGRLVLRAMIESGCTELEPVLINDLGSIEANAHLLKYDTVHGRFPAEVEIVNATRDENGVITKGELQITAKGRTYGPIKVTAHRNPEEVPLSGVDVAMECTGLFTTKEKASALLRAGARHVLVSAPCKEAEATIVYGVNNDALKPGMKVVSNGSCTTNCLSPVAHVLEKAFGIVSGYMLTVHSYTGDQRTVDTLHRDLRRARAAALNMIPTTTGAARAVGLVLPELKGKLDGSAIRVPTADVSIVSLDFIARKKPASADEVNNALKAAADTGAMKGVLSYNTEPLVSSDFLHSAYASNFDATQTSVMDGGELVRIASWYDNEWGFSNQMVRTATLFARL